MDRDVAPASTDAAGEGCRRSAAGLRCWRVMTAAHDYKQAKDEFVDLIRKFGEAHDELVAEGQHKPNAVQILVRMTERHFSHLTGDALEKKVQHLLATL